MAGVHGSGTFHRVIAKRSPSDGYSVLFSLYTRGAKGQKDEPHCVNQKTSTRRSVESRLRAPARHSLIVGNAGQQMIVIGATSGNWRRAEFFAVALCFSNHTDFEAMWSQKTADWIGYQGRAFEFFGAVVQHLVCGNIKNGLAEAHQLDQGINHTYQDLATRYAVAVLLIRACRPHSRLWLGDRFRRSKADECWGRSVETTSTTGLQSDKSAGFAKTMRCQIGESP